LSASEDKKHKQSFG